MIWNYQSFLLLKTGTRLAFSSVGEAMLTYYPLVMVYSVIELDQHWFSNGLLPDGNKPLPEPILTFQ